MQNILFVCTGNSCRSVMAEGLFKKLTEGRECEFTVSSAGISAINGFPPTKETIDVMKEEGMDVSSHLSRRLTKDLIDVADKIIVMEDVHKDFILRMSPQAMSKTFLITDFHIESLGAANESGVQDPIRMSEDFYRGTLWAIRECIRDIIEALSV